MTRPPLSSGALADLQARLRAELDNEPGVSFAYLYGSVLEQSGFRDIDIGVWTTANADSNLDLTLATRLSERVGVPVDVRRINDAPNSFLFHVLRGVLLVVRDELQLARRIEDTAREYHDLAPLRRQATIEAFGR